MCGESVIVCAKKYYLGKKTVKPFEDIVSRNSKENAYFVWGV